MNIEKLIKWAREACETERGRVGDFPADEDYVPSWLPELEASLVEPMPTVIVGDLEIEVIPIPSAYKCRVHELAGGKRTGEFTDERDLWTSPENALAGELQIISAMDLRIAK